MEYQSQVTDTTLHWSELEKWSELARRWTNYLPPFRPTVNDLKLFQDIIFNHFKDGMKINAMVLGATPEFRDLLYQLGASVTVVDQNPKMIEAMSRLRVYQSHEDIYIDDWFRFLTTKKRSFNLILSDLTQGNIPYIKQEEFFRIIAEALVPNGIFVDRAFTFRDRSKLYSADDEFMLFSELPVINLASINEMFFKCFCASDLMFELGMVDVQKIYALMRSKYNNPVISKYAMQMNLFLAPEATVWYYGKDWNQISQAYFRHLRLIAEIPAQEAVYRDIPFLLVSTPK